MNRTTKIKDIIETTPNIYKKAINKTSIKRTNNFFLSLTDNNLNNFLKSLITFFKI